jgi:hypothetical protein
VLQATVRDNRPSLAARGLLVYLLSLPEGWQVRPRWLREELGLTKYEQQKLLNELKQYGYAHLTQERSADDRRAIGKYWLICEFPNQSWLDKANSLTARISDSQKIEPYKNDPSSKNDTKGFSQGSGASGVPRDSGVKTRQRKQGVTKATRPFSDVPRLPFPESEEAMYATLEEHADLLDRYDVDIDPDRDGDFFNDFSSRDWRYPSGRRVRHWLAAYILRRRHIMEAMGMA